ncbi:CRAL-TRIO domain-containing protein C589.09, mitochondrial [Nematostella vectensis]|uniref:CRAL-TRIO domain-containing protein C589.09, mitochondrial n=1 Tax=Nematostella vectensis TaxID=45351 RepID=UPI00138FFE67|nr:CRAL-TRIO domain-containing protein C589.09, mitochondrial [Nematostella vectensis]
MTTIESLALMNYREEDFLEIKKRTKVLFEKEPLKAQTDACLKRFLRAFLDVDEAHTALLKYIKWRDDYGVDYLSNDDDVIQEVDTGKAVVLDFPDHSGRPIILINARLHDARNRDLEVITKFIIYTLEMALRKCNEDIIDNVCIAFDMKGFSFSNMDYGFVKQLIWLLSRRYPERLGVCLLINAPLIFSGCWSLIRLWINDVTANKIVFIRDRDHLSEFIATGILPIDDL